MKMNDSEILLFEILKLKLDMFKISYKLLIKNLGPAAKGLFPPPPSPEGCYQLHV